MCSGEERTDTRAEKGEKTSARRVLANNTPLREREREKASVGNLFELPYRVKFQSVFLVCAAAAAAAHWIITHGDGTLRHTRHTLSHAT